MTVGRRGTYPLTRRISPVGCNVRHVLFLLLACFAVRAGAGDLIFDTKAEAQAIADRIYADMRGKLEPRTVRWAIPYQTVDKDGRVVDSKWHVTVDERVRGVLSIAEKAQVKEWVEIEETAR